eukprot:scaffold673591_cov69-Prasinocladus_malaysianus.AAC.1
MACICFLYGFKDIADMKNPSIQPGLSTCRIECTIFKACKVALFGAERVYYEHTGCHDFYVVKWMKELVELVDNTVRRCVTNNGLSMPLMYLVPYDVVYLTTTHVLVRGASTQFNRQKSFQF